MKQNVTYPNNVINPNYYLRLASVLYVSIKILPMASADLAVKHFPQRAKVRSLVTVNHAPMPTVCFYPGVCLRAQIRHYASVESLSLSEG